MVPGNRIRIEDSEPTEGERHLQALVVIAALIGFAVLAFYSLTEALLATGVSAAALGIGWLIFGRLKER